MDRGEQSPSRSRMASPYDVPQSIPCTDSERGVAIIPRGPGLGASQFVLKYAQNYFEAPENPDYTDHASAKSYPQNCQIIGDLILSHVELGNGAFGSVFEASYRGQECAAKMLANHARDMFRGMKKTSGIQEARKKCILDECSFLEGLRHQNIIHHITTIFEPNNDLPILVMERMDCSLKNYIEEKRPLVLETQLTICHGVSSGLHYLHINNIIHRDLCDDNVLLKKTPQLTVKISDFGMSKMMDYESVTTAITAMGHRKGYLPPESETHENSSDEDDETYYDNKALYSHRLDIYSFGAVATQTVRSADQFLTRREMKRAFKQIEPQHPLQRIISSCLSKESHERPLAKNLTADIAKIKAQHV